MSRLNMARFLTPARVGVALSALSLAACDATIGGAQNGDTDPTEEVKPGGKVTPAGTIGEDDIPSAATRFRRLSHDEWQQTSADLFGVTSGAVFNEIVSAAEDFRADPVQGGFIFDGNGDALEVDSTLWSAYQTAATKIAYAVVSDAGLFGDLVPSGDTIDERGANFIARFGARAHRRPLTNSQLKQYTAVFDEGKTAYGGDDSLEGGVRLVLEAFLQSPHYLYRVEASDTVEDGVIPLDSFERASRLSYFFWGTMPDAELFQAANRGALDTETGVRDQAYRLVADPRARDTVVRFFEKVLEVERYETISPSKSQFPNVTAGLPASAHGETTRFLAEEMYENEGSLRDFMTSTTTYVDDELAAIYGLDGTFDDTFTEVTLPSDERAGIFTQVGFLATNATSVDPDPIHRGVFLARRINCIKIAAPPDAVPPLPTPGDQTNRELVTEHTQAEGSTCRNCHESLINPYGFAYEHYDAIGAFRTEDRSKPVDSATEVIIGEGTAAVADAIELAEAFAGNRDVHECLSGHLIAFAQGRTSTEEDTALRAELGAASLEDAVSFRDLMVEISVAVSFLNRSTEAE